MMLMSVKKMIHYCYMLRYTFILWSLICTTVEAQTIKHEVLHLTDAVVISEYLPCPKLDSYYIEGNHYIHFDGKTVPFKVFASFNNHLADRYGIPASLYAEEDPISDYLRYDYKYNLLYSVYERRNLEKKGQIESEHIYRRAGNKTLYVVYALSGEIVNYKTSKKIILRKGYKDKTCEFKPIKASKFAVLKKAEKLRPLTQEEAKALKLVKEEKQHIPVFSPE